MIPRNVYIFFTITFYFIGLGIYMSGFMPETIFKSDYVKTTSDDNCFEILRNEESCAILNSYPYTRQYEKIVLIVIDAFRADFVPSILKSEFNTSLPFVEDVLRKNNAISFINKVFSPTVTLPRLKTLMTGKTSNFIDIINNFNAKELKEDSFLHQAKNKGLKAVFYGDETWLKIYPNFFIRSEGTHSFYVQDFVEVDNNVTRHLKTELSKNDWDIMILHYLGVDHIGHSFGPHSKYLGPKLKEMDSIVALIYHSLRQKSFQNSLITICGDHGMTMDGNHGGVTKGETLTPLIFLSTVNLNYTNKHKMVSQVDIAVTLSILLGLPIPKTNTGTIILDAIQYSNLQRNQILNAMFHNALQLYQLIKYSFLNKNIIQNISNVFELHLNFLDKHNLESHNSISQYNFLLARYNSLLKFLSSFQRHDSTYDNKSLMLGLIVMWLSVLMIIVCLETVQNKSILHALYFSLKSSLSKTYFSLVFACLLLYVHKSGEHFTFYFIVLPSCILIMSLTTLLLNYFKKFLFIVISSTIMEKVGIVSFALHALSLFSSSYIEKEHILWYFIIATILILLAVKDCIFALRYHVVNHDIKAIIHVNQRKHFTFRAHAILILTHFVFRDYAFSCNEDITAMNYFQLKDFFTDNPLGLLFCNLLILTIFKYKQNNIILYSLFCFGSVMTYMYKIQVLNWKLELFKTNPLVIPNLIYILVILIIICSFYFRFIYNYNLYFESIKNNVVDVICAWILLTHLIGQNYLIPYTMIIIIQEIYLNQITWENKNELFVNVSIYLQMAMYSFFCQGNSNNLSAIDVSSGYVGLSSYQPILVGTLIACNTYRSIVLWLLLLYLRILDFYSNSKLKYEPKVFTKIIYLFLVFIVYRFSVLALYCNVMYMMKHHLFVLSVFAPKLFYEIAHTFIFIMCLFCLIVTHFVLNVTKLSYR